MRKVGERNDNDEGKQKESNDICVYPSKIGCVTGIAKILRDMSTPCSNRMKTPSHPTCQG